MLPLESVTSRSNFLVNPRGPVLPRKSLPSSTPIHQQARYGLSDAVGGELVVGTPGAVDLVNVCTPGCGLAPPKQVSITSRAVVPEKCIGLRKKARKRRRGGGGGDDEGYGGDDDGGDSSGGSEGDGWEDDSEKSKRFWMWTVLCIYSMLQSIYFVLFGNEKKAQGPFLAAITSSLCARVHAKCKKMISKKATTD